MTSALQIDDEVLDGFAADVGTDAPVAVEGGRTRWDTGGELIPGTRVVRAPTGIVQYEPAEMTVRVRAGTTVDELHAALAAAGQRTALPDRGGTVGGALAVGENHTEALGRGPVRDALLQIRYVSAEGELVTGGGPTVKNVTGFNLPKLMVGSLGTLGLFCEAILRTNPVPAVSRWLMADDADPFAVPDALLRPSAILWDGTTTWVLLEGHDPDVEAEAGRLAALGSFAETATGPELPSHRWSLRPSDLAAMSVTGDAPFVASIGVGTVFSSGPQPKRPSTQPVRELSLRMKQQFDPAGRFNPGRDPLSR